MRLAHRAQQVCARFAREQPFGRHIRAPAAAGPRCVDAVHRPAIVRIKCPVIGMYLPLELEAHHLRRAGDRGVAYAVPECQEQMALRRDEHAHFAILGIAQFSVRGRRTHGGRIGDHEDIGRGYARQQVAEFMGGIGKVPRVLLGCHRQWHDQFTALGQRDLGDQSVSALGERGYHAQRRGWIARAQVGDEPRDAGVIERIVVRFQVPVSDHTDHERQGSLRRTHRALRMRGAQGFGRGSVRQAWRNRCRAASESISPESRAMSRSQSGACAAARLTKCCATGPM